MSEPQLPAEEPVQSPQMCLAVINKHFHLVVGASSFGPLSVEKAIIDSGCNSLLLPWPDKQMEDFARLCDDATQADYILSGAVQHHHLTWVLDFKEPIRVALGGVELLYINKLRFAVTDQAEEWLAKRNGCGATARQKAGLFLKNPSYALVGQSILDSVNSIQFSRIGLLFLPPNHSGTVEQLHQQAQNIKRSICASPLYENELADLIDDIFHEDSLDVVPYPSLGRPIDDLGFGFR
jgi:hypothetical protein